MKGTGFREKQIMECLLLRGPVQTSRIMEEVAEIEILNGGRHSADAERYLSGNEDMRRSNWRRYMHGALQRLVRRGFIIRECIGYYCLSEDGSLELSNHYRKLARRRENEFNRARREAQKKVEC